ncbi:MAG: lipid A phosphoethanolamine transferase [Muribaculaceae bacterium]|nr:lipid A phosphoethanolamine transferase [Muribaculaceae bacterium]
MKRLVYLFKAFFNHPGVLSVWVVIVLIVPNFALNITENYGGIMKFVNVLIPLGTYMILMSLWKRTGITTFLLLPFMVLGAFQLVLLYLYGESIIAVDMFLNVVTTNMSEATELLSNLMLAIFGVILLYLPPLILAGIHILRKVSLGETFRKNMRAWGIVMALIGVTLACVNLFSASPESFRRSVFPVNVIDNMFLAAHRYEATERYHETSKSFTYNSRLKNNVENNREIFVYVIGETSRALNWQLAGYDRPTNPVLGNVKNLVFFKRAISESNTTHKSVPMLMSFACAENFDSINCYKSIITAMKEAGFYTRFYSNQAPNRSYIEYFGNEADDVRYTDYTKVPHPYDGELLPMVEQAVADTLHPRQFIVLHTYGSHFQYNDRYPKEKAYFKPDRVTEADRSERQVLVNAYDNAVRYTDQLLGNIIQCLDSADCKSALLYSADHGEDIFDDERERFLHASPIPTYYQLHVAMLAWMSDEMCRRHPEYIKILRRNSEKCVSPQKTMFNTALELTGVEADRFKPSRSLVNDRYRYEDPVYLTDLNQAVPLMNSGVKQADKTLLAQLLSNR